MNPSKIALLLLFELALATPGAVAHDVHLFATVEGEVVHGRAYFAGDEPAAGLTVNVLTGEGIPLGTTETDAEGRFTYVPEQEGPLRFVVETVDGHRATFTVDVLLPMPSVEDYVTPLGGEYFEVEMMQQQLRKQMEDMDREKHQVRARDVIGGLGYIVGVMGLIAFWKSRSGKGA